MTRHSRWLKTGLALLIFAAAPHLTFAQTTWRATVGARKPRPGASGARVFPERNLDSHRRQRQLAVRDRRSPHRHVPHGRTGASPFPVGCPGFSTNPATFDGSTCVSTPPVTSGQTFTVNFPAAGNFKLVCLLHENMTGVVHVLDFNEDLPHTQAFYNRQAAQDAKECGRRGCRQSRPRSQSPFVR